MSSSTNISELPVDPGISQASNIVLETKEKKSIADNILDAANAGLTTLPSRDIPSTTTQHSHDITTTANYVPDGAQKDYIKNHNNERGYEMAAQKENVRKSRKAFLLERFKKAAKKSSNVKHYQFWSHNNRSIELWGNSVIREKMNYIHQNPVVERLVYNTEDYVYGSVKDDAGEEGILENIVVFEMVKML